jgi:hypothetical protein
MQFNCQAKGKGQRGKQWWEKKGGKSQGVQEGGYRLF